MSLDYLIPGLTPTDLPGDRAGETWRFYVVDPNTLILRAVIQHDAAPAPIGASL